MILNARLQRRRRIFDYGEQSSKKTGATRLIADPEMRLRGGRAFAAGDSFSWGSSN
jgi:hypothetical protein